MTATAPKDKPLTPEQAAAAAELEKSQQVFPPLLALACAYRADWDREDLKSAMTAAWTSWRNVDRVLSEVYQLMRRASASPWELRESAKSRTSRDAPGDYATGLEKARAAIGAA